MIGLEGCISGNLPAGVTPPGGVDGPCGQQQTLTPVKLVFGPGDLSVSLLGVLVVLPAVLVLAERHGLLRRRAARSSAREQARRRLIGTGNHSWLLAVVVLIGVLAYVVINGASTDGPGARGLPVAAKLPPFAVPLAQSALSCAGPQAACAANVATKPRQGDAGARPPARCAGRRSSISARSSSGARSCSASSPRAAATARTPSTCSRPCGGTIPVSRWR